MGKRVSLFSGYSQKENRLTNYTLLILKLLYEYNYTKFEKVLNMLTDDALGETVGVQFNQQEKKEKSVPDGLIKQKAFTLYIEVKNWDWFYNSQLLKHLDSLYERESGKKALIAITSEFSEKEKGKFDLINKECVKKYKDSISFSSKTFEELLDAIFSVAPFDESFQALLDEYTEYLDSNRLLPDWQFKLDVVNCGKYPEEVTSANAYFGLTRGGAYSHKRCKYFGMYKNKRVEKVADIQAVIDVESDNTAQILWKNVDINDDEILERAVKLNNKYRPKVDVGIKVILLGELHDTDFKKTTKGGMFHHKLYFDIRTLEVGNAKELAEALNGKTWDELK